MKKRKQLPLSTHEKINRWLFLLGMLILVLSLVTPTVNVGMILGTALVVSGFVWTYLFRRCPHCGVLFPPRAPLPKHCPDCGKAVE